MPKLLIIQATATACIKVLTHAPNSEDFPVGIVPGKYLSDGDVYTAAGARAAAQPDEAGPGNGANVMTNPPYPTLPSEGDDAGLSLHALLHLNGNHLVGVAMTVPVLSEATGQQQGKGIKE